MSFKLTLTRVDGTRVWINMSHILKMEKTPDGRYLLVLVNGEVYPIDFKTARVVEDYLVIR